MPPKKAIADLSQVQLPPPGEDVTSDKSLWPSPAEGLFGLETAILLARSNTICALVQDTRKRVAA